MEPLGLALRRVEQELGASAPHPDCQRMWPSLPFSLVFQNSPEGGRAPPPYGYQLQAAVPLPGDEIQISRSGFRPLFKNWLVLCRELALHSSPAEAGAPLASGKMLGFQWQAAGAASRQAQPQHQQRFVPAAARPRTYTRYRPADSKGPFQAGSLVGLSPVGTVSVYLLGRPHTAVEDDGAEGRRSGQKVASVLAA